MKDRWFAAVLAALVYPMTAHAQKTPPMEPDPSFLSEITRTQSYSLGRPFAFRVSPDGKTVFFLRASQKTPRADLFELDVERKEERLIASAEMLLAGKKEKLSTAEKAARERKRIKIGGFTSYSMTSDAKRIILKLSGKVFLFDRANNRAYEVDIPKGVVLDPRLSPKGDMLAYVRDDNLYVTKLDKKKGGLIKGKTVALTKDGNPTRPHGVAEFVAQEEMSRYHGYWWAPDGKHIIFQSNDYSELEQFTIADAARPEAAAHVFPYPRPGKKNAAIRLTIATVDGKKHVPVKWDSDRHPYLTRVTWPRASGPAIIVQSRDQKHQVFLRIDPKNGKTTILHQESDAAWLNIADTTPRWSSDGSGYFWASEEKSDWRLEFHKVEKKKVSKRLVIPPPFGFDRLVHVDTKRELIWFTGGTDPRETHLFRVPLKGGEPERISPEGGVHSAVFSSDGSTFVLTRTTVDSLTRTTVHRVDELDGPVAPVETELKKRPHEIQARAKEPPKKPNVELVKPDDAGGFYAAIIRPHAFEKGKKYPVVVYVYGGPLHQTVRSTASSYFMHQWIADHGFVVVSIDGRGTPRRGRVFERSLRERFGDLPLNDQATGLKSLGEKYPELDLERVGVYGWSFGGYMAALAVLKRPDVFRVGVAGAPVVDWLYYDTHYTERYLGLPDTQKGAYEKANLLRYADRLERPLMLIHGIADDNVYFAHTLQLADALFRNGKPFELVPLVGLTHQVADPKVREALFKRIVYFLGQRLWS